ncbi:ExeM/NucH family extracellular endonuclease [Brevibacterium sp. JSBI002]|uniref:ExeM/NucH family extracellular endonuclease n=1 Tax=Brevibacterium sp. JSBI002 TaxID=2886045 RepID=UPI00222F93A1|nr:ExeM/NucH family extracellular endonuclease [Brevibacterium sp. JSBI002]UZD62891.1 ExeM/NucH family extracellular endonuclease [Brevibacterium sp. JSBI002]
MKVTTTLSSAAAISLVAGLSLPLAAATAAPAPDAASDALISEIAYTLDSDFIEIAAEPGTDVSGWTFGSVTRGGSVQAQEYTTTLPANSTVGDSGALAVEVPITNSVNSGSAADGGYGASAFAIDETGTLIDFEQIGGVLGGKGVSGAKNTFTPAAVIGQEATPTGATAASGQSIQLIDGTWKSAAPTPNALPDGDGGDDPGPDPEGLTPIADIQGTTDSSPLQGKTVTTRGVVTAAYPEGGLNGYYIQTPGTGGADRADGAASDGIFVYSPDTVADTNIDDHVEVTGTVSEHYGQTQISVSASGLKMVDEPAEAVKPVEDAFPAGDEKRESLEGMLLQPSESLTVADNYNTNTYGEVVLATGEGTLDQPTDVHRPGTPEAKALDAENLDREVVLDDGATVNFLKADKDIPLPYLSKEDPVRVGAQANFTSPVVLGFDHEKWRFQPTTRLTGDNAEAVQPTTFTDTRTDAPEAVGGQVSLASFNVLNYFTTTGDQLDGCQYYDDREGNHITVRGGCDARGAANAESLKRQETKIVTAINKLDASVVSLMEIENSAAFGKDRDDALSTLVKRLNEAAGTQKWDFVDSPAAVPSNEDVIRTALIYQPAEVAPQNESTILDDQDAFSNAREPLSQAFAPKDGTGEIEKDKTFVTISNHFKSKGSGSGPGNEDSGDGQGASNADRVKQAEAVVGFAGDQQEATSSDLVYLLGDFNSYTQEDPMQVFYEAGYKDIAAEKTDESTYVYGSRTGSLDHVLALDASDEAHGAGTDATAFDSVTGADVWNINSVESLALEYSRFNYNVSDLFAPDQFRASDHDPVIVGLFDANSDGGADDSAGTADGADQGGADGSDHGGADGADQGGADGGSSAAEGGADGANVDAEGSGSSTSGGSSASADSEAGGNLPRTGTDPTVMMAIAAGLVAVGAGIVLLVRRRRMN